MTLASVASISRTPDVPVGLGLFLLLGVGMLLLIPVERFCMRRKAKQAAEASHTESSAVPPGVCRTNPDLAALILEVNAGHPYANAAVSDGSASGCTPASDAPVVEHRRGRRGTGRYVVPADPSQGGDRRG